MIKGLILLMAIYSFASIYNQFIQPFIIYYITIFYYNNIVISLLILIQIDNFLLFYDLMNKNKYEYERNKVEDKYIKLILNGIDYINKKEKEFTKKKWRFKENNFKIHRSCNDIYDLK